MYILFFIVFCTRNGFLQNLLSTLKMLGPHGGKLKTLKYMTFKLIAVTSELNLCLTEI
jgi:hypothetical protein